MGLEAANYIAELVVTNPVTGTDAVTEGADHLRILKRCLKDNGFPNFEGTTASPKSVTLSEDQINDAALKSANNTISGTNTFSGANNFTVRPTFNNEGLITLGDVPPLPATIAYTDQANTFTANQVISESLLDLFTRTADKTLLQFGTERPWQFRAVGSGPTVGLALKTEVDSKYFDVLLSNDIPVMRVQAFTAAPQVQFIDSAQNTVANSAERDAGSFLVADRTGAAKKAGFRNPTFQSLTGAQTLSQNHEGQILGITANGLNIDIPQLEAGTTVRIINTGTGAFTLNPGTGVSLRWTPGFNTAPGAKLLARDSVAEIVYASSTVVYLFGSGISVPV